MAVKGFLNYKHDFNQRSRYVLLTGTARRQPSTPIWGAFIEKKITDKKLYLIFWIKGNAEEGIYLGWWSACLPYILPWV